MPTIGSNDLLKNDPRLVCGSVNNTTNTTCTNKNTTKYNADYWPSFIFCFKGWFLSHCSIVIIVIPACYSKVDVCCIVSVSHFFIVPVLISVFKSLTSNL